MSKVGFIGLGIMGKPMAINLVKAGYDVTVYNRSMAKCEPVVEAGAKASTAKEIAESCDVIVTMLPNSPQVEEVLFGADGIAEYMKENKIEDGYILGGTSAVSDGSGYQVFDTDKIVNYR